MRRDQLADVLREKLPDAFLGIAEFRGMLTVAHEPVLLDPAVQRALADSELLCGAGAVSATNHVLGASWDERKRLVTHPMSRYIMRKLSLKFAMEFALPGVVKPEQCTLMGGIQGGKSLAERLVDLGGG